ncbi:N-carbamoylputrescine amidase [Acrasis kona]|uniref:N-carbamoylputrescine amidase n=1 Tax=Acrasis kona TaxID=1008807 RepID=A0AAW2ZD61_9EUKA
MRTEESAMFAEDWHLLEKHLQMHPTDILVLPEMPFNKWFMASKPTSQEEKKLIWIESEKLHQSWLKKISILPVKAVISSFPTTVNGSQLNEAFVLSDETYKPVHYKRNLPEEPGTWEKSWYSPAKFSFQSFEILNNVNAGVLLCSELWFFDHSRAYGQQNTDLIFVPRATAPTSLNQWVFAGQSAAVVSGAFVASSNRFGETFGGRGYIISPDGDVLGITTPSSPFITIRVNTQEARAAKETYPRYVSE